MAKLIFDWGRHKRLFYFMATVLERFNKLGLASSNSVLSAAGAWVSERFKKQYHPSQWLTARKLTDQIESDGKSYQVLDYPNDWVPELDKAIWAFINQNDNPTPEEKKEADKIYDFIERPKRKRIISIKTQTAAGTTFTPKASDELDNLVR